eukprot:TRINITY_DN3719_c1_g2_i1.p2 TRINITY_DN3719_c1_g2~~TRINITY_DN3719_c1_g2_i1.p2  ORF type:complete len:624 (-),score=84.02 TRINITY_DN3719_c1_g2_i1:1589-3460(-)
MTVSFTQFCSHLEKNTASAIAEYNGQIMLKLKECIRHRKIDIKASMKALDTYKANEITVADFLKELKLKVGSALNEGQYQYIMRKYETSTGRINYVKLCEDLETDGKKVSQYENEEEIVSKLRQFMYENKLKLATVLLDKVEPVPLSVLEDLFPKEVISEEELGKLTSKVVDKNDEKALNCGKLQNLFWTSIDEEKDRENSEVLAKELNEKIARYCKVKSIDLGEGVNLTDDDEYLSPSQIKAMFHQKGIKLSDNQMCVLLYYQNIGTDEKGYKRYLDVVKKVIATYIEESSVKKQLMQDLEPVSEEAENKQNEEESGKEKNEEPEEKKKEEHAVPKLVTLGKEHVEYAKSQLNALSEYFKAKGITADKLFGEVINEECIDPSRFFAILEEYEVKSTNLETQDILYSYLKHPNENAVSLEKVYKAIFNDRTEVLNRLKEFIERNEISVEAFARRCESRVITKAGLGKILNEIDYKHSKTELNELYSASIGEESVQGCLPLLISKIFRKEKVLPLTTSQTHEVVELIRKKCGEHGVTLHKLYASILDIRTENYVDLNELSLALSKLIPDLPSASIQTLFYSLDHYKYFIPLHSKNQTKPSKCHRLYQRFSVKSKPYHSGSRKRN